MPAVGVKPLAGGRQATKIHGSWVAKHFSPLWVGPEVRDVSGTTGSGLSWDKAHAVPLATSLSNRCFAAFFGRVVFSSLVIFSKRGVQFREALLPS